MRFKPMKEIALALKEERAKIGDISLRDYVAREFKATPEDLYHDLGINPSMTVETVFSTSEHTQYIMPEIIRDAILLGMRIRRFKDRVIVKSVKEPGTVIECPYIDFSQIKTTKNTRRTPAATIMEDSITYGSKLVKTTEVGKAIKFPLRYSQLRRLRIDLLPLYFQAVGIRIENDLQDKVVTVIQNGEGARDKEDNVVDESAMVIGVNNTTDGITEADYFRAVILMNIAGKPVDTMITSDTITNKCMRWETFKPQLTGAPETQFKVDLPLPSSLNIFPILDLGNKMILQCTPLGVIEHLFQPLEVNADLVLSKRIEEAYATMEVGYSILYRSSRIIIDGTIAYNDNQVLPWLFY